MKMVYRFAKIVPRDDSKPEQKLLFASIVDLEPLPAVLDNRSAQTASVDTMLIALGPFFVMPAPLENIVTLPSLVKFVQSHSIARKPLPSVRSVHQDDSFPKPVLPRVILI